MALDLLYILLPELILLYSIATATDFSLFSLVAAYCFGIIFSAIFIELRKNRLLKGLSSAKKSEFDEALSVNKINSGSNLSSVFLILIFLFYTRFIFLFQNEQPLIDSAVRGTLEYSSLLFAKYFISYLGLRNSYSSQTIDTIIDSINGERIQEKVAIAFLFVGGLFTGLESLRIGNDNEDLSNVGSLIKLGAVLFIIIQIIGNLYLYKRGKAGSRP